MADSNVIQPPLLEGETPQERIANGLARRGLSIEEAAELLKVRWQTVQFWTQPNPKRRKPRLPHGQNLHNLARLLGVTIDEILGVLEGQDPSFPAWQEFKGTPQWARLEPWQRRQLQAQMFGPDQEPTLTTYLMLAAGLGTTKPRQRG